MTSTAVSPLYKTTHVRRRFTKTSNSDPPKPLFDTSTSRKDKRILMNTPAAKETTPLLQYHIQRQNNGASPQSLDDPDVTYLRWGIFNIAYDKASSSRILPIIGDLQTYRGPCHALLRLLKVMWHLDPWHCALYYLCTLWMTLASALSLYIGYLVVAWIEEEHRGPAGGDAERLQIFVLAWLLCGMISYRAEATIVDSRVFLGGRLRSHFTPQLVQASLQWDPADIQESQRYFPYPHDYGDFIPGWGYVEDFFSRLRHLATIFVDLGVFLTIIWQRKTSDAVVLCLIVAIFFFLAFCSPSNGVGGKGYTFWTNDANYNRLMVLFNIIFDLQYRESIVKDGLTDMLVKEYQTVSTALGDINADVWTLGWGIRPAWYWGLTQLWINSYPMALYALTTSSIGIPLHVGSMALLQYALYSMRTSVDLHMAKYSHDSFLSIISRVEAFYNILKKPANESSSTYGVPRYLRSEKAHANGMKISTSGLSYSYFGEAPASSYAVNDVNVSIEPGKVVVVTGSNGSGKTTFMKLLSGALHPSKGEVNLDGVPACHVDANGLRQATVFVGQSEVIYPVTIKENIVMGLGIPGHVSVADLDIRTDEAVHFAGAAGIVELHGYHTVLNPCSINSFTVGNTPGPASLSALKLHSPVNFIRLSSGERQKLVLARAMFRAMNGANVKLVILDEATNALDVLSEYQAVTHFKDIARKRGQTLIIVTHRLSRFAEHADSILCMNKGRLESQGTHRELLSEAPSMGNYGALYHAQVLAEAAN